MGFENRKATRIKTSMAVCYWADGAAHGPGTWGQALNLSESGLAFRGGESLPKEDLILVEFSLPGITKHFRLFANVVSSVEHKDSQHPWEVRLKFFGLEGEDLTGIRRHILQVADPKLAAVSGWGRAIFEGRPPLDAAYRELDPAQHRKFLEEKAFFSAREVVYLKKFQEFLEMNLGGTSRANFKVMGSRPLKDHALAWMQLSLPKGHLHILAKSLWCTVHDKDKAELGLSIEAYNKEEALKVEKAA